MALGVNRRGVWVLLERRGGEVIFQCQITLQLGITCRMKSSAAPENEGRRALHQEKFDAVCRTLKFMNFKFFRKLVKFSILPLTPLHSKPSYSHGLLTCDLAALAASRSNLIG